MEPAVLRDVEFCESARANSRAGPAKKDIQIKEQQEQEQTQDPEQEPESEEKTTATTTTTTTTATAAATAAAAATTTQQATTATTAKTTATAPTGLPSPAFSTRCILPEGAHPARRPLPPLQGEIVPRFCRRTTERSHAAKATRRGGTCAGDYATTATFHLRHRRDVEAHFLHFRGATAGRQEGHDLSLSAPAALRLSVGGFARAEEFPLPRDSSPQ